MIYSNERKLALSGWLRNTAYAEYCTSLKLQKFLFFYEAFSKVEGADSDFSGLKGWKRGPVFSAVWGDYTKEPCLFAEKAVEAYFSHNQLVNIERAAICKFIVSAFNQRELSDITHAMDIWGRKKSRIESGEHQVELDESDFTENDEGIIINLKSAFPIDFVRNSTIINIDAKSFIFHNHDSEKLTEAHYDALYQIVESGTCSENPIYVSLDDSGVMNID